MKQMTQSETNTINPADQKTDFPPTINLNKIDGKEIFITGYEVNRGKPNDYTNTEDIGEDGLTDYRVITTEASFDLAKKAGEEVSSYNHFYVSKAVGKQIARFADELANGKRFGPVKPVLRAKTDNPTQSYRALANESDEDYN